MPQGWEAKARELGALKFGRRFSGPESLLCTLLMYLSEDCSMVETIERARAGQLVALSDVGLLKRVIKSGAWLGWITEQLIQQASIAAMQCPTLQGRRILAADGSVVTEPGAITSTSRLHYAMDIGTLRCQQAQVTPVKNGESYASMTRTPRGRAVATADWKRVESFMISTIYANRRTVKAASRQIYLPVLRADKFLFCQDGKFVCKNRRFIGRGR